MEIIEQLRSKERRQSHNANRFEPYFIIIILIKYIDQWGGIGYNPLIIMAPFQLNFGQNHRAEHMICNIIVAAAIHFDHTISMRLFKRLVHEPYFFCCVVLGTKALYALQSSRYKPYHFDNCQHNDLVKNLCQSKERKEQHVVT